MKATRIFVFLQQKVYEVSSFSEKLERNSFVVISISDIGEAIARVKRVDIKPENELSQNIKILRQATEEDMEIMEQRREEAQGDFKLLKQKIVEYKKDMYPISAQISLDGNLFYATFTAPERIDFRDLVKDLSSKIGKRIFFEQVGVRDRAKSLGDLGKCGLMMCCQGFLDYLPSVSMENARTQNLSSQQLENITGICGKLKCCLNYEADNYREQRKNLPKMKRKVVVDDREGKVIGLDILNEKVKIKYDEDGEIAMVDASQISYPNLKK